MVSSPKIKNKNKLFITLIVSNACIYVGVVSNISKLQPIKWELKASPFCNLVELPLLK